MTAADAEQPRASADPAAAAGPDASERIEHALPCRRCGYDLRTQRKDGRCPECGDAVTNTVELWSHGVRFPALPSAFDAALRRWSVSLFVTGLLLPSTLFFGLLLDGAGIGGGEAGTALFMTLVCVGVGIEYTLWAMGFRSMARVGPEIKSLRVGRALGELTAVSAGLCVIGVWLMTLTDLQRQLDPLGFGAIGLGIAVTQGLRLGAILAVLDSVFQELRGLRLGKHLLAIQITAGMAMLACVTLGLSHFIVAITATLDQSGGPDAFLAIAIFAAMAVYPTSLATAVALGLTTVKVRRRLAAFGYG
ncbi:MAG: hypothetical protein AAGE65_07460 [Planctomycetota bacterium]